jgi:hypothetical protein
MEYVNIQSTQSVQSDKSKQSMQIDKPELVLIFGFILSIIILFTVKKYGFLISLYTIIVFCIASYNLHCVIHGKCIVWSNILTFLYVIYASILIYFLIFKNELIGMKKK